MGTRKKKGIHWLSDVERHDYGAAASYLGLIYPDARVRDTVARLRRTKVRVFKAKDIFRAARLPLLGAGNSHVDRDREKIRKGEGLSPILLVRDPGNGRLEIADGYHRLCAVYLSDEDAMIPCKIV